MNRVKIPIIRNGKRQKAELLCDSKDLSITISMADGYKKSYSGSDFYKCFGNIRKDLSDITFLCKGAKINVHPSSMSSQMTQGVKAYELTIGKYASRSDLVNIFDYEDTNLTNDPKEQEDFFIKWVYSEIIEE